MRLSMAAPAARAVDDDFDGFYTAHFGDTVAMTYTFTADLGEAQDIAQEAFCRAWRRWSYVGDYDNPVAWVRRVAVNLAHSRWRRMRLASERLVRLQTRDDVPELNPDHVAVVAALRKLPARHREAVVLHHLMDLPVTEVAEHFGVPVGTVKSWLSRGRAALAGDLSLDVRQAVRTPPVERVKRRSRGRAVVAVAVALALAGGVYLILQFGPLQTAPVPPVQSPTPSPSPAVDPADPILAVRWQDATLHFDADIPGCERGETKLNARVDGGFHAMKVNAAASRRFAYGDLNGDGRAELAVPMVCFPDGTITSRVYQIAVIERGPDGRLAVIAMTHGETRTTRWMWIRSGVLYAYLTANPPRPDQLGELRTFRLTGEGLRAQASPGAYPQMRVLNLNPVADKLSCRGTSDLTLRFDDELRAWADGREFMILRPAEAPLFAERGRRHLPYLMLTIGCRHPGETGWFSTTVVFDEIGGQWRAVDTAQSAPSSIATSTSTPAPMPSPISAAEPMPVPR